MKPDNDLATRGNARKPTGTARRGGPAPVPSLDGIIGYKLRRAQLAVFQDFIDTFVELGLRPAEFSVLFLVARNPGQKQAEIATALAIKPANLVTLMDGLEKRGFVERRKANTDRRSYSLYLTPRGERFAARMFETWCAHENRMIARLGGEAERDRVIALLDRLLEPDDPDSSGA
jgi:DNA-binding MarR family transcriptional regulator